MSESRATRRKRSSIWIHFDDVENDKARCKSCKVKISHRSGFTNNLHRHLKLVHPPIELEQLRNDPTCSEYAEDDHPSSDTVSEIASTSGTALNQYVLKAK